MGRNLRNADVWKNQTSPVGSFPDGAGPFGHLDLAGNVYEWCSDWFVPYGPGPDADPTGPASGEQRVVRGGAWNCGDTYCETTDRFGYAPGEGSVIGNIGLRVCKSD